MLFVCSDFVFHSIQDLLLSVLIALSFMDQFEPRFPRSFRIWEVLLTFQVSTYFALCSLLYFIMFGLFDCSVNLLLFPFYLFIFSMLQILSERWGEKFFGTVDVRWRWFVGMCWSDGSKVKSIIWRAQLASTHFLSFFYLFYFHAFGIYQQILNPKNIPDLYLLAF